MAKKADLHEAYRSYSALSAEAARAEQNGDHVQALQNAVASLAFQHDSVAFLRRFQKIEAPRLTSVELILRLAPLVFDPKPLDAVADWLAEANRAERKAYPEFAGQLDAARRRLALALRAWPSHRPAALPPLAVEDARTVQEMLAFWTWRGAVLKVAVPGATHYRLVTHPDRLARGKCHRCGAEDRARLAELLAPRRCPHCRAPSEFAVLERLN
jgi:hypothetical protein